MAAGGEAFFFKVYLYGRHSRKEIEAEIVFANDLLSDRIPVAAPVQDRCSEYIIDLDAPEGTRYGVLFRAVVGDEPQETNLAHSVAFGRVAARIHACADRLNKVYQRRHLDETYLIQDPICGMQPFLQHRPADLDSLARFGEDLVAELCALLPKRVPQYGVCHGDLHTGNARLGRDGCLTLIVPVTMAFLYICGGEVEDTCFPRLDHRLFTRKEQFTCASWKRHRRLASLSARAGFSILNWPWACGPSCCPSSRKRATIL